MTADQFDKIIGWVGVVLWLAFIYLFYYVGV